jgi:hypothetical protein
MSNPFINIAIRNWYFPYRRNDIFPIPVVLLGSDPFEYNEFKSFLTSLEFNVYKAPWDIETLIVGRYEWNEDDLNEQINLRNSKKIHIYSQEMFISYLSSGKNPYDNNNILNEFTRDHPAFHFFRNSYIDWPNTDISITYTNLNSQDTVDWLKKGILDEMGYKVGIKGVDDTNRRNILLKIYTCELPKYLYNKFPESYLNEWGPPSSGNRLLKMANTIAALARNFKRKNDPSLRYAINDWETDLNWLKDTFYNGRYIFNWPSIDIELFL